MPKNIRNHKKKLQWIKVSFFVYFNSKLVHGDMNHYFLLIGLILRSSIVLEKSKRKRHKSSEAIKNPQSINGPTFKWIRWSYQLIHMYFLVDIIKLASMLHLALLYAIFLKQRLRKDHCQE